MIAHLIFSVTMSALVPGPSIPVAAAAGQPVSSVWSSQQHRFIQKLLARI